MSTFFRQRAFITVVLSACAHAPKAPLKAVPAPGDSSPADHSARKWTTIRIDDGQAVIEMQVPALTIAGADGARTTVLVDSVALRQVERRLTARMGGIARAEASALKNDTTVRVVNPRHLAEAIKPGLLGAIPFSSDSLSPTETGRERIASVAHLAKGLPGALEIVAETDGTGAVVFDVALARARLVYFALLESVPGLADREVVLTVRTHAVDPGAPRAAPTVSVFSVGGH